MSTPNYLAELQEAKEVWKDAGLNIPFEEWLEQIQ